MRLSTKLKVLTITAASSLSISAHAIDLSESVSTDASAKAVWAALEDFCSIKVWHPVIAECEQSEKDGNKFRTLMTGDGGKIFEQLNAMDSGTMSFTYSILEGPLPISDYVSTMTVKEDGDGAMVTWSSNFNSAGVSDEEATELMRGIYKTGLDQLKTQVMQ